MGEAPAIVCYASGLFLCRSALHEVAALAPMPEQNTPTGAGVGRGVG